MEDLAHAIRRLLAPIDRPHEPGGRDPQTVIQESVDPSLRVKQIHAAVGRPMMPTVDPILDELIDSLCEFRCSVLELAVGLDFVPSGRDQAIPTVPQQSAVERGTDDNDVAAWAMARRVADVEERVRSRLPSMGEVDTAARGAAMHVARVPETRPWLVRGQKEERT